MEALLTFGPMVATAVGTGFEALGQIQQGDQANAIAKAEAAQLREKGKQEFAIGAANAAQKAREAKLANSRNIAVAAASGAGASDATVTDIMADTEAQGVMNSLTEMYNGLKRQTDLNNEAKVTRYQGKATKAAALPAALGTVFSGLGKVGKMAYDYKYG